eukprot:CAMPEP_0114614794 /NCGR_PEP_ID=MMETSP0168-20121206/5835_1 /TAXON_ID=95228 ORGANISM="Vannella sp., Strain DIVA3 517/6/12" /NCGR_SAMPLE_ID=MMETSP0168 /ASSEMBLY_ACC=CAM_ASM_000044 /LENGTH=236 /DNA_ID=CAMNT_0001825849 /DNA_START=9 /DNA_END=720 /DNA_ORIENTATION=+
MAEGSSDGLVKAIAALAPIVAVGLGTAAVGVLVGMKVERTQQLRREAEDEEWSDEEEDEEEEDDEDDEDESDERHKMVLCVRTDLGMGKGKIAAQCCHATLGAYKRARRNHRGALRTWERLGQAKIALKVPNLETLLDLDSKATQMGVTSYMVADAGHTQVESGTITVLAIGPAPVSVLDQITGKLKLLYAEVNVVSAAATAAAAAGLDVQLNALHSPLPTQDSVQHSRARTRPHS